MGWRGFDKYSRDWFQYAGLKEWDFAVNRRGQTIARYWPSGLAGVGKVGRRYITRRKGKASGVLWRY